MEQDYAGVWPGTVESWEIVEIEKINQLKLVVWFNVTGPDWKKKIKFESLFLKKDGTKNKKTFSTLKSLGFRSKDVGDLITDDKALDKSRVHTLTIEPKDYDGKTYYMVEWVQDEEMESTGKVSDVKKLKSYNLSKLNSFLDSPKESKIKNMAPSKDDLDEFLNS